MTVQEQLEFQALVEFMMWRHLKLQHMQKGKHPGPLLAPWRAHD